MRYWWVNHKQTVRQEVSEGCLWAPTREANGARSQFYDNMRIADVGDGVLSFADGRIAYAGTVASLAFPSPKPPSFGETGGYWSNEGWLLPVEWRALRQPVSPKLLIAELRQWLPGKYSPIHPVSGNGNQKAYLAEIPEPLFQYVLLQSGGLPFDAEPISLDPATLRDRIETALEQQIAGDTELSESERRQLVNARRGQGTFRRRVSAIEKACRLTGLTNPLLLRASHIKPWRSCSSTDERLDGANGLMLAPHVDCLFDKGLISFEATGEVRMSPRLVPMDVQGLGLEIACSRNVGLFSKPQEGYLEYHRENVFVRA